jgi:glutaminyl-tRNA synthetase
VPALGTVKLPFARTVYIDRDDFRLEDSPDYFRLSPGKTVGLFQAPYPITCTSYETDPATGELTELFYRLEDDVGEGAQAQGVHPVGRRARRERPVRVDQTGIYYWLFKSDNPLAALLEYKADIDPHGLEAVRSALVKVGFWAIAKRAYADAVRESKEHMERALVENATEAHQTDTDTPAVTSTQLVGKECVRLQGLRVAYFALDNKDAPVACLDEAGDVLAGRRPGDYVVLNRIVSLKEDSGKAN